MNRHIAHIRFHDKFIVIMIPFFLTEYIKCVKFATELYKILPELFSELFSCHTFLYSLFLMKESIYNLFAQQICSIPNFYNDFIEI